MPGNGLPGVSTPLLGCQRLETQALAWNRHRLLRLNAAGQGRLVLNRLALVGAALVCLAGVSPPCLAQAPVPAAARSGAPVRQSSQAGQALPAQPLALSLNQVLQEGMAVSRQLVRADRQLARDQALTALNRSLLRPELNLIGLASYTQVGTSVGLLTNLPTLGDISLSLEQNGYAVLRNSFGNAGVVFNANLLPLRQLAEVAASSSQEAASRASRQESQRQARFELVSSYRQLQLSQALVPVWQAALQASTAVAADVQAIHRRGLADAIFGMGVSECKECCDVLRIQI